MTNEELDDYIEACTTALETRQDELVRRFKLGTHPRWGFDHLAGVLWFGQSQLRPACGFRAHAIGSYSPRGGTFQWAWASSVLPEHARSDSEAFKALSDITGLNIFTMPAFNASEEMAWQVCAMCLAHTGGLGCYRAHTDRLSSFLLIRSELRSLDA